MYHADFVTHLWDLVDEGMEAALDVLQGRIGAGGVCVPVVSGPIRHVRFAAGVLPRTFHTRGGVHFQPAKSCYLNTRCKPPLADWLKTRNPLEKLALRCRDRGLTLRAVVECLNLARIAEHEPHFARKNVFGDASTTQVCLVNPDLAEFLRGLVDDLRTHYGIETVELTGLEPAPLPDHHSPPDLGVGGRELLALCFCESCRQAAAAAAVDYHAAARTTTVRLEGVFQSGRPIEAPLTALVDHDQPLAAYLNWHRDRLAQLVSVIRGSSSTRIATHTRPLRSDHEVEVHAGYLEAADEVVCPYAAWEPGAVTGLTERTTRLLRQGQAIRVQLSVCPPGVNGEQALVRTLGQLADLGVPAVNLDHYGCLPRDRIDPIKQAIRFARRTFHSRSSSVEAPP